jgi:hypothetical protein
MDIKARRPARRHTLERTFRFDRTRFILYHLSFGIFATWPGTGEWFQQAAYTHCKMKCARLSGAGGFQVFKSFSQPASCNSQEHPGCKKNRAAAYYQSSWKIRRR